MAAAAQGQPGSSSSSSTAQLAVSSRLDALLTAIQPSSLSEFRRLTIAHYICGVIKRCFQPHHQVEAFMFGSVPLRAVLPDGDIDISVFTTAEAPAPAAAGPASGGASGPSSELRDTWATQLLRALEREAVRPDAPFKIRDVQIIQAEVKLVKCVASDVVVDVSFDTVGGLCTVAFLEAADRRIGRQHLFKRSILLLKAWCYYESRLLGAHHGLISSYALEVLVLYIFNLHHADLHTPLDVLRRFLAVLSSFDWERYCLALQGPLVLAELHNPHVELPPGVAPLLDDEFMQRVLHQYSVQQYLAPLGSKGGVAAWGGDNRHGAAPAPNSTPSLPAVPSAPASSDGAATPLVSPHFPLKHLNIVDPLLLSNNLGRSVSKASFARVRKALALGSRTLEAALLKDPRSAVEAVDQFFRNTWRSPVRMAADNQTFLARLSTMQLPPAATEAVVSAAAAAGFPLHAASPSPSPSMGTAQLAMPAHAGGPRSAGMDSLHQLAAAVQQQQQHHQQQHRQQPTVAQLASLQSLVKAGGVAAGRQQPGAYTISAQQQQALQQQLLQARLNGAPAASSHTSGQATAGDSKGHIRNGRQSPTAPHITGAAAAGVGAAEPGPLAAGIAQPAAAADDTPADSSAAAVHQVQQQVQEVNSALPADSAAQDGTSSPASASPSSVPRAGACNASEQAAASPLVLQPPLQQQRRQEQVEPPGGVMDGWQGGRPPLAQPVMAVGVGGLAATAPNTPVAAAALGKLGTGVPYLVASSQLGAPRQGMGYGPSGGRWSPTAASTLTSGGGARWSPTAAAVLGGAVGALAAPRSGPGRMDSPHSFFGGDLMAMERNLMVARRRQRQQQQTAQQQQQQQAAQQQQQQAEQLDQAGSQHVELQQQAARPAAHQQEVQHQAPPPPQQPALQQQVLDSKSTASNMTGAMRLDAAASVPSSDASALVEGASTAADQLAPSVPSATAEQTKESAATQGKPVGAAPGGGDAAPPPPAAMPGVGPPPLPIVPRSTAPLRPAPAARERDAEATAPGEGCPVIAAMAALPAVRTSCMQPGSGAGSPALQHPQQPPAKAPPAPRSPAKQLSLSSSTKPPAPRSPARQPPPLPIVPRGVASEDARSSPKTFAAALRASSRSSSSASLASPAAVRVAATAAESATSSPTKSTSGRRPAWGRGSSSNLAAMGSASGAPAPPGVVPAPPASTPAPPAGPQPRSWSAIAAGNVPRGSTNQASKGS